MHYNRVYKTKYYVFGYTSYNLQFSVSMECTLSRKHFKKTGRRAILFFIKCNYAIFLSI